MTDQMTTFADAVSEREQRRRTRSHRVRNRAVNIGTFAAAAMFAYFFWCMALDGRSPILVDGSPRVLNTGPVPRNGVLRVEYTVTVFRPCGGEGQRVFTDSAGTQSPAQPFSANSAEREDGRPVDLGRAFTTIVELPVPVGMAPGRGHYVNETHFYCNVWQRLLHHGIEYDYPQVDFDVRIGEPVEAPPPPAHSLFKHSSVRSWDWFHKHVWSVGDVNE